MRVFEVSGKAIIEHAEEFEKNGSVPIPSSEISEWPGQGAPGYPNRALAPFYDANGNGVYDPIAGDYPVLQNECNGPST